MRRSANRKRGKIPDSCPAKIRKRSQDARLESTRTPTHSRLRDFGIRDVIINVHHFAGMVIDYLLGRNNNPQGLDLNGDAAIDAADLLIEVGLL